MGDLGPIQERLLFHSTTSDLRWMQAGCPKQRKRSVYAAYLLFFRSGLSHQFYLLIVNSWRRKRLVCKLELLSAECTSIKASLRRIWEARESLKNVQRYVRYEDTMFTFEKGTQNMLESSTFKGSALSVANYDRHLRYFPLLGIRPRAS